MKIKAIAFDVGGVLELGDNGKNLGKSVHGYVAKKLNLDLDTYFDIIGGVHEKSVDGRVTRKRMVEIMTLDFGISSKKLESLYSNGFGRIFKRNNELYDFAFCLKEKYKIGILSDQWYFSKDALIREKDIRKFDFVVISCDDKLRKPSPKIYKLALKRAGVKPSEMVFIDNRKWNNDAAEKLGIKTILFKNNKQCFRDLKKLGVERC